MLRVIKFRVAAWLAATRTARRELWAWTRHSTQALLMPTAWALLTWAAFGFNRRAWAASIGIFIVLWHVLQALEAYYTAKQRAEHTRKQ